MNNYITQKHLKRLRELVGQGRIWVVITNPGKVLKWPGPYGREMRTKYGKVTARQARNSDIEYVEKMNGTIGCAYYKGFFIAENGKLIELEQP